MNILPFINLVMKNGRNLYIVYTTQNDCLLGSILEFGNPKANEIFQILTADKLK